MARPVHAEIAAEVNRVHFMSGAKKAVGGMDTRLARGTLRQMGYPESPEEGKQRPTVDLEREAQKEVTRRLNSDAGKHPVEEAERRKGSPGIFSCKELRSGDLAGHRLAPTLSQEQLFLLSLT